MASYGLYTHTVANKTRSIILLLGLFLLVYVAVYAGALIIAVANQPGEPAAYYLHTGLQDVIHSLPWSTGAGALWIVIAYFFHQSIIDSVTGGRGVTRKEQPRLYNLLENLCIARGIPMPKLKIIDSDVLNAYATGLNRKQYSITVTSGLLRALDDQEIEAVLGHELAHIRNGDVQMMVIAVIITGAVGFFAELFFRGLWRFSLPGRTSSESNQGKKNPGGAILVIVLAVGMIALAWLLSQLVRLALSRSREYLADAGSVELTKNPDAMISALRKIEGRGELPGANSAVMELCLDNPRQGFADLFATHPSVDARVKALVEYAGGHDVEESPLPMPPQAEAASEEPRQTDSQKANPWGTAENDIAGPWGRR